MHCEQFSFTHASFLTIYIFFSSFFLFFLTQAQTLTHRKKGGKKGGGGGGGGMGYVAKVISLPMNRQSFTNLIQLTLSMKLSKCNVQVILPISFALNFAIKMNRQPP